MKSFKGMLISLRLRSVGSISKLNVEVIDFLSVSFNLVWIQERLVNLLFPASTFIISISNWGNYTLWSLRRAMRTWSIS